MLVGDFYRDVRRTTDRECGIDQYRHGGKRVDYYAVTGALSSLSALSTSMLCSCMGSLSPPLW